MVAALLFAGRAGSALTAEIGLMRARAAFQYGNDGGRSVAACYLTPFLGRGYLATVADYPVCGSVGIWGGSLVGVHWKGIDAGFFWSAMQDAIDLRMDLVNCLIKSVVFAITVTWIALFNGF